VDNVGNFSDVFFEKPQGVGIGYHDAGGFFIHDRGYIPGGQDSLIVGFYRYGLVSAQGSTGRVGPVSGVRYDDFRPGGALALMVGIKKKHAGQFTVSSGSRLEGSGVHAGDFDQIIFKVVH